MLNISINDVLRFHKKIIDRTVGSYGVRDLALIESAINRGSATFDGKDLYNNDIQKIAVITYALIKNHGFVDGNKRVGVAVMLLLIKINNINIKYTQDELVKIGLNIAEGTMGNEELIEWIKNHL